MRAASPLRKKRSEIVQFSCSLDKKPIAANFSFCLKHARRTSWKQRRLRAFELTKRAILSRSSARGTARKGAICKIDLSWLFCKESWPFRFRALELCLACLQCKWKQK
ncbi:hypothetical protein BaRGS_00010462 [Batillaria attramentaria]|uniref:Ribosomal protein L20 n=1 Tax=Batillaria attramentaria TaxID=370345 RepID=A0ABD0LFV4_9CAEN